jgi:hypothetical protein
MDGVYATGQSGTGVAIAMDNVYAETGSTIELAEHSLKAPVYEISILNHV